MRLKQTVGWVAGKFQNLSPKALLLVGVVAFLIASYLIVVLTNKQVVFSYAGDTCVRHLTFFPAIHAAKDTSKYDVSYGDEWHVGALSVAALKTCFTPLSAPEPGKEKVVISPWGGWFAPKTYIIQTGDRPVINMQAFDQPLAVSEPLRLNLSTRDTVFDYHIEVNSKRVACKPQEAQAVLCDIPGMQLHQGELYTIKLTRSFRENSAESLGSRDVRTVTPVALKKSTVQNNQTVYNRPKSLSLAFSKELGEIDIKLTRSHNDKNVEIPITTKISGVNVVTSWKGDLPRKASYKIVLQSVKAKDGSSLAKPQNIAFKTSGGPRVVATSIGAYDVNSNATITLTLDQAIKPGKSIASYVGLSGGAASVVANGKTITLTLRNLPRCKPFSIQVKHGLMNKYDVVSTDDWSFSSRTRCRFLSTIGYSVNGRPITANYFGSGSRTYLFTGAIHGNELSSKYIMDRWVAELEANPSRIPSNVRVVVVPTVNPDGASIGSRPNAHNVNLNRNFPTDNWESNIEIGPGQTDKGGGGKAPLSEPESKALARLVQSLRPYITITYHSSGSLVNTNELGVDETRGRVYANAVGYQFVRNSDVGDTFGFEMTGTLEKWMHEELGLPGILVELNTDSGYYFDRHRSAMWALIR